MFWKKLFSLIIAIGLVLSFATVEIRAATFSDYTSGDMRLSQSALSPVHEYLPFIHYRTFDLSDRGINAGSGVTDDDVIKLFNVDENTFIEEFGIRVTTAALITGTSAEVGDGADIDGYVGNDITDMGIPFIDLSSTSTGCSAWRVCGPFVDGWNDTGSTSYVLSGVSITFNIMDSGLTVFEQLSIASNAGPYFTNASGSSPYLQAPDTIDMTIYTDKVCTGSVGSSGVTPIFEAYIKGFKRVSP